MEERVQVMGEVDDDAGWSVRMRISLVCKGWYVGASDSIGTSTDGG